MDPTAVRRRKIIGVMGAGDHAYDDLSRIAGRVIAQEGYHLLAGGGGGVMAAVARAFTATPSRAGLSLGVVRADGDAHLRPHVGLDADGGVHPEDAVVPLRGAALVPEAGEEHRRGVGAEDVAHAAEHLVGELVEGEVGEGGVDDLLHAVQHRGMGLGVGPRLGRGGEVLRGAERDGGGVGDRLEEADLVRALRRCPYGGAAFERIVASEDAAAFDGMCAAAVLPERQAKDVLGPRKGESAAEYRKRCWVVRDTSRGHGYFKC